MSANVRGRARLLGASALLIAMFCGVGWVGWLAGRRATSVAPALPAPPKPTTIEVTLGELVVEQRMTARLTWEAQVEKPSLAAGVVTRIGLPAGVPTEVSAGTVLYHLDETPVLAIPGEIPAFRDMKAGVVGADIVQIQEYLQTLGLFTGAVDGKWGNETTRAVKVWQRLLNTEATGFLRLGTVLFFDSLPALMSTTRRLVAGAPINADDAGIAVLDPLPSARLIVPTGTSGDVSTAEISLAIGTEQVGFTTAGGATTDAETGEISVPLQPNPPTNACPAWCDTLRIGEPAVVAALVRFDGPFSGPLVPIGVIQTEGSTYFVVTADGARREVSVKVQVNGQAIVEGVTPGDSLLVPAP